MLAAKFALTLKTFNVKGVELCNVTGIHSSVLSNFLTGTTDPRISTLERLLEGLESLQPGAVRHFCTIVAAAPLVSIPASEIDLADLVNQLDAQQLAQLLRLIGDRLSRDATPRPKAKRAGPKSRRPLQPI